MPWVALLLLTGGVIAAIIVPLLRARPVPAPSRAAFDRAVYRDQLGEIARDFERGTLDADQAAAARLEIERRLLATDEPERAPLPTVPVDRRKATRLAAAVAATVAVGTVSLYLALGSPDLRDQPLAMRRDGGAPAARRTD